MYKSYGNLAIDYQTVPQPLRLPGQYFDEESRLHYNRHRYYDPHCARYISQDPIGLAGGENAYSYVANPITWIDPLGLDEVCPGAEAGKGTTEQVTTNNLGSSAHNAANYEKLKLDLNTTESANNVVESLRNTGQLPPNYVNKTQAVQQGWAPGKALNNTVPGGQIGGDIFHNTTGVLPTAPSRIWYEADIGLSNTMSRSNQQGTRLLYSNDGLLYITTDHYKTATQIGRWK
ncbi:RHS repeat-associated core domain-containing protein [Gilliamella apicola]|uniref:RHS repeat-associated core domain-containing protein n=1 Tax=Gilliamella apicola TaxID=1196095 RepID=UPI002FEE5D01